MRDSLKVLECIIDVWGCAENFPLTSKGQNWEVPGYHQECQGIFRELGFPRARLIFVQHQEVGPVGSLPLSQRFPFYILFTKMNSKVAQLNFV